MRFAQLFTFYTRESLGAPNWPTGFRRERRKCIIALLRNLIKRFPNSREKKRCDSDARRRGGKPDRGHPLMFGDYWAGGAWQIQRQRRLTVDD
jgi:hypothetical protein